MVRNYNQHNWKIVELKSGSNSQKENTNGNKRTLSLVSWLATNVYKLITDDWNFISLLLTINVMAQLWDFWHTNNFTR